MGTPPDTITGRCMCGSVSYSTRAEPGLAVVCHCTDCQKQTGSTYTVVIGFPKDQLTIEGDTLGTYSTMGEDHKTPTVRNFCSACGSPIVTFSSQYDDHAFIKVGTLDDPSWVEPKVEI